MQLPSYQHTHVLCQTKVALVRCVAHSHTTCWTEVATQQVVTSDVTYLFTFLVFAAMQQLTIIISFFLTCEQTYIITLLDRASCIYVQQLNTTFQTQIQHFACFDSQQLLCSVHWGKWIVLNKGWKFALSVFVCIMRILCPHDQARTEPLPRPPASGANLILRRNHLFRAVDGLYTSKLGGKKKSLNAHHYFYSYHCWVRIITSRAPGLALAGATGQKVSSATAISPGKFLLPP